jgi:hypothetical protein
VTTSNAFEILVQDFPFDAVGVFVPIASFGMVIAIVCAGLYYRFRAQGARQDLIRSYLERGQPVPPALIDPPAKPTGDLRRGLVLVAAGIGISLASMVAHNTEGAGVGLIPALIGIAYLIVWKIERKERPASAAELDG